MCSSEAVGQFGIGFAYYLRSFSVEAGISELDTREDRHMDSRELTNRCRGKHVRVKLACLYTEWCLFRLSFYCCYC